MMDLRTRMKLEEIANALLDEAERNSTVARGIAEEAPSRGKKSGPIWDALSFNHGEAQGKTAAFREARTMIVALLEEGPES